MNLNPQIFNFTIEDGQPNRVYFQSTKQLQIGTNATVGFIIQSKTIVDVTINTGAITGHYFTLASSENFWTNILIRYEGGGDMRDLGGNLVFDFTLQ